MKITAITFYKHGDLWGILQRLEWSQRELARRSAALLRLQHHQSDPASRPGAGGCHTTGAGGRTHASIGKELGVGGAAIHLI